MNQSEESVLPAGWRSGTQSIEYEASMPALTVFIFLSQLRAKLKIDLQPQSKCQHYKTIRRLLMFTCGRCFYQIKSKMSLLYLQNDVIGYKNILSALELLSE